MKKRLWESPDGRIWEISAHYSDLPKLNRKGPLDWNPRPEEIAVRGPVSPMLEFRLQRDPSIRDSVPYREFRDRRVSQLTGEELLRYWQDSSLPDRR